MKTVLLTIIFSTAIGFYLFNYYTSSKQSIPNQQIVDSVVKLKSSINIVFYQDVSRSTVTNGIELVSSSVFTPYFNETHRSIELNFGCIANMSSHKLISVNLPYLPYIKPKIPDLSEIPLSQKRRRKEEYMHELRQYQIDSINYFSNRNYLIHKFSNGVDSLVSLYRKKLTSETDLITAITIADKVFNYSINNSGENILILNSDGLDSYGRQAKKLNNKVKVVLINADGRSHTSIDSITTTTLQSSEQAIQFSLAN